MKTSSCRRSPNGARQFAWIRATAKWALQRRETVLGRIAIVDDNPEGRYLYPEFVLARETFRHQEIDAVIADPAAYLFLQGEAACR